MREFRERLCAERWVRVADRYEVLVRTTGRGLMTGQYKSRDDFEEGDFRKWAPRFSEEVSPGGSAVVP